MSKLLNTIEASAHLGISPSHTARLAKQGRIPGASQPGGRDWLFEPPLKILPPERDGRRRARK